MSKIKKRNALTVAIILSGIVILSCSIILILHNEFGLMFGDKVDNTSITIEFTVCHNGYVDISKGDHLYLSDSRESLGFVDNIKYDQDGTAIIVVKANGLSKDGTMFLNGSTYIAKGTRLLIMNSKIEVEILNIM